MKIGFFSDVHANWEALSACLKDFEGQGLNKLFFLGDAVGYGADPNLVVEKIEEICEIRILGNHDAAVIGILSPEYFNQYAQKSFFHTRKVIAEENFNILKSFDLTAEFDKFFMVHALPRDPQSWGYILTLGDAEENFGSFNTQVCLIGHSHRPVIVEKHGDKRAVQRREETMVLDPDCRYIINVGSVGQPRDGDPRACYMVYDSETDEISYRRVEYDLASAQAKMREANMPGYLVDRLSSGK